MVANDTVRKLAALRGFALLGLSAWLLTLGWVTSGDAWAEAPADVPNVIKFQIDAALTEFKLKAPDVAVLLDEPPADVDRSLVVVIDEFGTATNPDGGATTQVRLVPGVLVPALSGLSAADARDQLSARDLVPTVLSGDPSVEGVTVTDQNIAPESLVAFNTPVGFSLSVGPTTSTPPSTTSSAPALPETADDSVPWLWIIVGGVVAVLILVGGFAAVRLLRRPRKPLPTHEAVEVRARAPAPPTTHLVPFDDTPTLSLWLDPHPDPGDQVLEEVRS